MSSVRCVSHSVAFGLALTALPAFAQQAPAPAPAPAPVPAPKPAAAVPAPVPPPAAAAPAPVAAPAPAPSPAAPTATAIPPLPGPEAAEAAGAAPAPAPAPVVAPAPEPVPPPPPPEPATPWYDAISFGAFADAYVGFDFNFPKGQGGGAWRQNPLRAYDRANGFALAQVGLDLGYDADIVGGTLQLRFGPEAELLNGCEDGRCDNENGLANVKQGFATWRPGGSDGGVAIDLGKFDTPYGAEVADSQYNLNYTRGVLYWLGQPAFHTGLRVTADVDRSVALRFLAVNGWNRSLDNNAGKSFGLQGTYRLPKAPDSDEDLLTVSLGYLMGPERVDTAEIFCDPGQRFDLEENPDTGCVPSAGSPGGSGVVDRGSANSKGLRHFIDLTAVATPTEQLTLILNGSYGTEKVRDPLDLSEFVGTEWYGVMVAARYAATEQLGVGGRFEYFADPDGVRTTLPEVDEGIDLSLVTTTLTLDYSPARALTFKLDGRLDWSNKKIFPKGVEPLADNAGTAVSATLGAVISTN